MVPIDQQIEIIRATRAAAPTLVLNARVDVFITRTGGIEEAVERGNAYLAAGADCIYPILAPFETLGPLAEGITGPVNVLARPENPRLQELEELGDRTGHLRARACLRGARRGLSARRRRAARSAKLNNRLTLTRGPF